MTTEIDIRLGATPQEWDRFKAIAGQDLLPTVCDPSAVPSDNSTIKNFGKIPSAFNKEGKAYGIHGWTNHKANHRTIDMWKADSRLGICLITRNIKALDIDVDDPMWADAIEDEFTLHTGIMPARIRSNSGKRTLLFRLAEPQPRRKIKADCGLVEFLGDRQQTVIAGTHPSGVRYEWREGLPEDIPELTIAEVEAGWNAINSFLRTDVPFEGHLVAGTTPRKMSSLQLRDPAVQMLEDKALVKSYSREGAVYIECPWIDEHTVASQESSTTYFPAGYGGHAHPGFKCLHGHCEHRTVLDFFTKIGYVDPDEVIQASGDDFDVITRESSNALPELIRDKKGKPVAGSITNVVAMVGSPHSCGFALRQDTFLGAIYITEHGKEEWRPLNDNDNVKIRMKLEAHGVLGTKEMVRDAISAVAEENTTDTAIDWLEGLKWDGVKRIDQFHTRALRCTDNEYAKATARYMWTAMAGRALKPGIKADMVPLFIGKQGSGKTTMIQALVPSPEHYLEVDLSHRDDNLARAQRGKLVGELAELRGLNSRDAEAIKAWVTRTHEEWIPKYKELGYTYARRAIFIGTSNHPRVLNDPTGERRWLPLTVGSVGQLDVEWVKENLEQLWAEARELFKESGILWREADKLAHAPRIAAKKRDAWFSLVSQWLQDNDHQPITAGGLFQSALAGRPSDLTDFIRLRLESCLVQAGYELNDRTDVWTVSSLV